MLKNSEKMSQNLNHVINNFSSESPPGIDILMTDTIKNLEKISEFYVERRMNASIKTLIEGKGVDDIL